MHVVVVGLGVTGDAVVRHTRAAGDRVTVIEDAPARDDPVYGERAERALAAGAEVLEVPGRADVASRVQHADLLVLSPGVEERHPAVAVAQAAAVPIRAEIDLAAEQLRVPLVAVTGTNGKTTVTTLVAAMLEASAVPAVAVGNIGTPLLDVAGTGTGVVVAEVSSFQLAFTTAAFRPRVALLLNVAEDHLDWHGSFDAYTAAKARVFAHQGPDDAAVFNADDRVATRLTRDVRARRIPFTISAGATDGFRLEGHDIVAPDGSPLARVPERSTPAERANALAAAAAALEVGATPAGVTTAISTFRGLPHRRQLIGEVGGVRWYDDSKATNPHATAQAIAGADGPVVLIAGGRNKGLDLGVLASLAPRLRAVVTIGEAAGEVEAAFAGSGVAMASAVDMSAAAACAARLARPGDVVLLSPACASFDWYPDYRARGDDFAREFARTTRSVGGTR